MYDGHQYISGGEAQAGESHGLTVGTKYYNYVETTSERPLERTAHVIYFAPGTDPPTETSGSYVEYTLSVNNVYSNPTNQQTITLDDGGGNQASTSCAIQGIGWIVCGLSTFLAQGMDFIFEALRGFVEVLPVTVNDPTAPLFTAWNIMRSFANIAFIIAFLIIIYSQITGAGISSYGLKKLLPRLVIAALLVNVSYYIAAIAIDLSNVIGYSLQQVFISVRQDVFNITNDTWNAEAVLSWESIVGFILSGGTIAAGLGVGVASVVLATALNPVGLIFIALPALMGLILAVLVVLLILAARQAIIVILVVLAPLAFVAYLLPNTEKWFGKWRDLFMTMLIFFPAFSLVFGGSQLAGGLIIQNANSINVMLFGMIVQVAPLVITPLLLKLSGSLLGRIAGLVNNPGKGLIDRTRNWTKPRIEQRRLKTMNNADRWYNIGGKAARAQDYRNRRLEKKTELGKAQFEDYALNRDYTSRKGQEIATDTVASKHKAEEMQHNFDQAMQELRAGDAVGLERLRGKAPTTGYERIRMTRLGGGKSLEEIQATRTDDKKFGAFAIAAAKHAAEMDQESRIIQSATSIAQATQQKNFAKAINGSVELQKAAGGIDPLGADTALASAINTVRESYNKSVNEARAITKHFNLSSAQRQAHALGDTVEVEKDGIIRRFTAADVYTREAVIEDQVATGTIGQIQELVQISGKEGPDGLADFRTTISEALAKNGLGGKTLYLGGKTIDDVATGRFKGPEDLMAAVIETIGKGKISQKDLANIDKDAVEQIFRAAERIKTGNIPAGVAPNLLADLQENMQKLSTVAQHTLVDDERVNIKPNSKEFILKMARLTNPTFEEEPIPTTPEENDN
jgi:hypothetical protein